eukprot:TRINITY_DN10904_c0_g1_i1.p1 TRINITY_DN10904_c0_g1~~TRINITY_DN10904_c0_g1_i1.p1  ORF type:complete len:728 (+),score=164.41 TRINITY_DN10904_c0_g1_i1:57-2240(+)
MPALTFLGRRWYIGSDDFILLPFIMAGVKYFWVAAISVLLARWDGDCNELEAELYFIGAALLCFLLGTEELLLAWESRKGGVMTPSERSRVPTILSFRLSITMVTAVWTVYGSVIWVLHINSCEITNSGRIQEIVFDGLIISEWVSVVTLVIVGYMAWDPNGRRTYKRGFAERHRDEYRQRWIKRIKRTCCCVSDRHEAFQEIAELFANMFRNTDLVPSDILVGLVLLRKEQKECFNTEAEQPTIHLPQGGSAKIAGTRLVSGRKLSLSPDNGLSDAAADIIACESIYPAAHTQDTYRLFLQLHTYMRLSLGAYGWPMYCLEKGCVSGFCGLLKNRCCSGQHLDADRTQCKCYSVSLHALEPDMEIVWTRTRNDNNFTPYTVLADHDRRELIVTLRGTLSLEDLITDARAEPAPIVTRDGEVIGHAHKGIFLVAENVTRDLKSSGILDRYLKSDKGYNLILTGHSLGAGTASLAAVLLFEEYPQLQCYAFSPPGGLGDEALAKACKEFVVSVVFDKDFIPRLSEVTIQKARDELMRCLAKHAHVRKHRVLGTCGCGGFTGKVAGSSEEGREAFQMHSMRVQADRLEQRVAMYPVGRVLHFLRDDGDGDERVTAVLKRRKWEYTAVWRSYDELQELIVSHKMINDHFPQENLKVLTSAITNYRNEPIPQSDKYANLVTANTTTTTSLLSKITLSTLLCDSHSHTPLKDSSALSPLLPPPSPTVVHGML